MSKLALTSSPQRLTELPHARWVEMGPKCTKEALWLKKIMLGLDRLGLSWGMTKHYQALADRERNPDGTRVLSPDRWKKMHAKWKKEGIEGLINHTLCGGNCRVPSCNNRARKSMLAQSTVNHWISLAAKYKAPGNNLHKTRTLKHGWESLILALQKGETIPGVDNGRPGTWRAIYRRLHPLVPMDEWPETCPWDTANPPHGYTFQNFTLRAPAKVEITGAISGFKVIAEQLPQVQHDYTHELPLQTVIIDDVDLDVMCCGSYEGRMQVVRVGALMLMDGCSRRIVGAHLFPQWEKADGSTVGISRRDVQHAFCDFAATFGWRKDGTTFISENATAAFTDDFCDLVHRVTDQGVTMKRSGLFNLKVLMSGFGESGGNPRGKARLERFFGYLAICLSDGAGATGGSYSRKPADLARRLQQANKIIARLGDKATTQEIEGVMPVEGLPALRTRIMDALHRMENRTNHQMQGFERVRRWRPFVGGGWMTFDDPVMLEMINTMGTAAVNQMLAKPGLTEERMESPVERWTRLYDKRDMVALDALSYFDLMMDRATVKYAGLNVIKLEFKKAKIEFRGTRHNLMPGQDVEVAFNIDQLEMGAFLRGAKDGRPLGQMDWAARAGDRETLEQRLGERQAAKSDVLERIAKTNLPAERLAELIEAEDATIARMEHFGARAGALKPATEATKALVKTLSKQEDEEIDESRARYLERAKD